MECRPNCNTILKNADTAKLSQPDWSDRSHSIALSAELPKQALRVYLIFNAYWDALDFELRLIGAGKKESWRRWIDASLDAPQDTVAWKETPCVPGYTYRAGPRSLVVLWAKVESLEKSKVDDR